MEILLVTKNQIIGLDEDATGISDFEYFSVLPNYLSCIGLISKKSMKMLSKNRQKEIGNNIIDCLSLKNDNLFFKQKDYFFLYNMNSIKPVLYEVPGYNCIISFKGADYNLLKLLKPFFYRDSNFSDEDFKNLETNTNYLICSYYEGDASFLYTNDGLASKILDDFNRVCLKNGGAKITIEKLRGSETGSDLDW